MVARCSKIATGLQQGSSKVAVRGGKGRQGSGWVEKASGKVAQYSIRVEQGTCIVEAG